MFGADSVSDFPGSPVKPSTHDNGYDKRFNIWNDNHRLVFVEY